MTNVEMASTGLTEREAAHRLQTRGKLPRRRETRPYASILRANTFTGPNGMLLVFGVLTITFASWRDALFLGILAANIALGPSRRFAPNGSSIGLPRWLLPMPWWCAMGSSDARQ